MRTIIILEYDDAFFLVEHSIVSEQEIIDHARHTVNRDHDPPFLTQLQLNPNSERKIRQNGRKK